MYGQGSCPQNIQNCALYYLGFRVKLVSSGLIRLRVIIISEKQNKFDDSKVEFIPISKIS